TDSRRQLPERVRSGRRLHHPETVLATRHQLVEEQGVRAGGEQLAVGVELSVELVAEDDAAGMTLSVGYRWRREEHLVTLTVGSHVGERRGEEPGDPGRDR